MIVRRHNTMDGVSESNRNPVQPTDVTMLGLGAMGSALATALLAAGHSVTVWNRTPGRDTDLVARGARAAGSVREAVTASPAVVACLLKHRSVHETFDPVVDALRGRTMVNLTTTTPNEARELASWAADHADPAPIAAVQALIARQIAEGHGSEGFARVYESMRARVSGEAGATRSR